MSTSSSTPRRFPVWLSPETARDYPDCPRSVPWWVVGSHEAQALANHGQDLVSLAGRGGLGIWELLAVVGDVPADVVSRKLSEEDAVAEVKRLASLPDSPPPRRRTLAVDFDGVLHRYSRGWQGGAIYDGPVDCALDSLQALQSAGFRLVVFTAREDLVAVRAWLLAHGFPADLEVTNRKPPA